MTHQYDYTLKELFKNIPSMFLKLLTGFEEGKFLDIQFPDIKQRQPDLLIELPDGKIFHLEIQSKRDASMRLRMLEYYFLIYKEHKKEPEQLLLYVGDRQLKIKNEIKLVNLAYRYRVLDIKEIDCLTLLESDKPEDIVLAILCKTDNPEKTIKKILERLSVLSGKARKDYILKLLYLAGLRKLDDLVEEEVKKMPITIDVKEHVLFKEGLREGIKEGLKEGLKEARKEDIVNLYSRLNLLPEKIAEALNLDIHFVKTVLKEAGILKE